MNALADVPNTDPAQANRISAADASRMQLIDLCA